MVNPRSILRLIMATEQAEGVGARVRRSIGTMKMRNFTPFLMLDHFNVSPDAGFPQHPHLGQETVTYVTKGQMAHEDFNNHISILNEGDLQFMTAGKGIVHSEMPVPQEDGSNIVGMQLWVDLPENLKETEPRYRDLRRDEIPVAKPDDKVTVKVISGTSYGVESLKDLAYTPMNYYHYKVAPGGKFEQEFDPNFNVFLYLMNGTLKINDQSIPQWNAVFFKRDGDKIVGEVSASETETAEFVLIGGQVLDQEIIQHGPFVACNKERIYKGFMDYQGAQNAFKNLRTWDTTISGGVTREMVKEILAKKDDVKDEL